MALTVNLGQPGEDFDVARGKALDLGALDCQVVDCRRVNKKAIEALVNCGVLDSTGATRAGMLSVLEHAQAALGIVLRGGSSGCRERHAARRPEGYTARGGKRFGEPLRVARGHALHGCMNKVFRAEIDVEALERAQRSRHGFGGVKMSGPAAATVPQLGGTGLPQPRRAVRLRDPRLSPQAGAGRRCGLRSARPPLRTLCGVGH